MLDLVYEPINQKKCGCYVLNPDLVQLRPKERILVPLRTCEYDMEIVNAMVNVTLVQTYHNPTEKFLELEYSFPISPNACVYRFVAEFGNTRIEGVVKEKEQAKKEYEQAVKMGKQAAYSELNAESKDILNLKVGNVSPKQQVKIEIVYLQQLSLSYNTFYQLHLPGTISPRYVNHIPNQEIIKGYRKKEGTQTQGTFTWSFKINLRTTRKVNFFDSHTHSIQMMQQNDTCTQTTFVMEEPRIPNKNFVFSYTTEEFELPNYVFGRTDVSSSAMLSFIPKFCSLSIDDAYKASVKGTAFESDIDSAKGEYVFLLDRSGSMGGTRIQKAKQALVLFIKNLPQNTYFNVVSFGSGSKNLFGTSVKYGNKEVDQAVNEVKQMSADMGGTEIYSPLQALLNGKLIEGYPKQIFLLTDGGVSNTEGVIKMVGLNNKYSRVHTIGIGNGASQQLIMGCAKKGKGYHVFINDSEDPSEKIIQLLTDSLSPVISKMKLSYDPKIVQSIIPNPQSLPYILKGQIVNFYITFKGQLDKKTSFAFSYQDSQNKLPYKSEIEIDPESTNESFIDRMGHFKRIRLLQDSHTNNSNIEDMMFYVKKVDKKAQIIEQSVRHQILSEFTAFICVEQEMIDGKYQEVKSKGKVQVIIDNPLPQQKNNPLPQQKNKVRVERDLDSMLFGGFSGRREQVRPIPNLGSASRTEVKCPMPMMRSKAMQSNAMRPPNKYYTKMKLSDPIDLDSEGSLFKEVFPKIETMEMFPNQSNFLSSSQKKKEKKQCIQPKMEKECMERTQSCFVQSSKEPVINRLVSRQNTEGFWKDVGLIAELFDSVVEQTVKGEKEMVAVITYLIAKWIQKHYPQKQYSLIVKKALNYVRKEAYNFESYQSLYDKYLK